MKNEFSARGSRWVGQGDRKSPSMVQFATKSLLGLSLAFGVLSLGACSGDQSSDSTYPSQVGTGPTHPTGNPDRQTIFGEDGITLFGGKDSNSGPGQGIGVNSFLWRASLDTISFMPLASADPFGGVIITDWYQDPNAVGERFKLTVYILDKRLRADGVKVSVFRQKHDDKLGWVDTPADPSMGTKIENAILVRARQLRIASTAAGDTGN